MSDPAQNIVKRGFWMYDGQVRVEVRITRGDTRHGSGDHEDEPDVRDDQNVETFTVWHESTTQREVFNAGGGQLRSLAEAIEATNRTVPQVIRWEA